MRVPSICDISFLYFTKNTLKIEIRNLSYLYRKMASLTILVDDDDNQSTRTTAASLHTSQPSTE